MMSVQNVAVVGNRLKGEREALESTVCQVLEENNQFKSFQTGNNIELEKTSIAKAKMLFTWSHVKGVDCKGWDHV